MSKKIEESISKIVAGNDSPDSKIKSLLALKYNSTDINNIKNAIITIFKEEYNAELADMDIDAEVSNIAYRNEGIKSVSDEKLIEKISLEKDELINSLTTKLAELKETRKIEEPVVEVEEMDDDEVIDAVQKDNNRVVEEAPSDIENELNEIETNDNVVEEIVPNDKKEFDKGPLEPEKDIYQSYRRSDKNYDIYNADSISHNYNNPNIDRTYNTLDSKKEDYLDSKIDELKRKSAALIEQVNHNRQELTILMGLKARRDSLIEKQQEELKQFDQNAARQRNAIKSSYEEELTRLYRGIEDEGFSLKNFSITPNTSNNGFSIDDHSMRPRI